MNLSWNNIEEQKPNKVFGNAFEFWVKPESMNNEQAGFMVIAIWDGFDWYLPHFESVLGYQGTSGNQYFETYTPKYWREFTAPNLAY